ncbi:MAG: hypothetical protein ABI142_00810, partial [Bryocella sp.]
FISLFYLASAGWAIATIVGLVRLRPWSRISILVIGGCLAAMGLLTALVSIAMPKLIAAMPATPHANPHAAKVVFAIMGIIFLLIAGIGVWWLVYFSSKSTRAVFGPTKLAYLDSTSTPPPPNGNALDSNTAQRGYAPETYSQPLAQTTQSSGIKRPISITILAIIFGVCGTAVVPTLFLGSPMLLGGFIIHGGFATAVKLVLALWLVGTGLGLYKLQKEAWYLAVGYCAFGVLNTLTMLLPGGMRRMGNYMHEVSSKSMVQTPGFDPFNQTVLHIFIIPGILFGVAMIALVIILLWRARWAFGLAPRND